MMLNKKITGGITVTQLIFDNQFSLKINNHENRIIRTGQNNN